MASPHALFDVLALDGGRGKTMHNLVDRFMRIGHMNVARPCSPTLWDRLGQVTLGHEGLLIGWDRWDWDMRVFRLGGTGWDWDRGVFRLDGTRWNWDRSLFELSLSQWDRFGSGSVTVPCACTTWYLIKNRSQKLLFLIKNQSTKLG